MKYFKWFYPIKTEPLLYQQKLWAVHFILTPIEMKIKVKLSRKENLISISALHTLFFDKRDKERKTDRQTKKKAEREKK
jgi:hypothetical protein